jgi:hypothetical protein
MEGTGLGHADFVKLSDPRPLTLIRMQQTKGKYRKNIIAHDKLRLHSQLSGSFVEESSVIVIHDPPLA